MGGSEMVPADQATIVAARITAAATLHAAWIQWTAGAMALLGAIGAGVAAYKGATRQVRLQERQAKARTEAYRFKLTILVDELYMTAAVERSEAKLQLDRYCAGASSERLTAMPFLIPDELTPGNWSDHALLGITAVRGIHRLYDSLKDAIRFSTEMRGQACSTISIYPTTARIEELSDGGVELIPDVAVIQHLKVADNLLEAVKHLQAVLENQHGRRSNMGKKEAYDVAIGMFKHEHDRWIQNTLFLFGALASLFLTAKELQKIVPLWLILGLATLISTMAVCVALSIRASTDAWGQTVREIERLTEGDVRPFERFDYHLNKISHGKDFMRILCVWRPATIFSVTRMYTLLGIVLAIFFAFFTYRAIMCGSSL